MQTCANGGEICANGGKRQSGQRLQELLAFFRNKKPPLTEGKVSTGAGVMSKMMCLRNEVVPAEQMMCLRNDVPLRGNGGGGCRRSGGWGSWRAQSSAASSRLPSFLACSTTAGTSISGRIS